MFQFRQIGRDLRGQYGPQQLGADTNFLYSVLAQSPAFIGIMNQALMSGIAQRQTTNTSLARLGGSTTGVGSVQRGLAAGFPNAAMQNAQMQLFMQALQAAGQNQGQRLQTHSFASQNRGLIGESFNTNNLIGTLLGGAGMIAGIPGIFGRRGGNQEVPGGGYQLQGTLIGRPR